MTTFYFALDAGNGYLKYTDGRKLKSTVHAIRALEVSDVRKLDEFSGSGNYPSDYLSVYDGVRGRNKVVYETGDVAREKWRTYETGARRYKRGYYDVLALRALTDILNDESFQRPTNDNEIVMMCTHAPQDSMHRNAIIDTMMGRHRVERAGKTYYYNVVHVETVDEPVAGLFCYTLGDGGFPVKADNLWKRKGRVLVIDIGAYTTDFQEADHRGVPLLSSSSLTLGVIGAKERFKTLMRQRYPQWLTNADYLTEEMVENAFRNRVKSDHVYASGTRDVVCTDEVKEATLPLISQFLSAYRNQYRNGEPYATILLTGGGCGLLNNIIRDNVEHQNIILVDNIKHIHLANAKGASRLLSMMARKGIV